VSQSGGSGPWEEMHEGSAQTDRIIAADERVAGAMETSTAQAQLAYAATVQQAEIAERAWLSVDVTHRTDLRAGKPFLIRLTTKNTGRTPAINVKSAKARRIIFQKDDPTLSLLEPSYPRDKFRTERNIVPGSDVIGDFGNIEAPESVKAINSQQVRIYIHGRTEYEDAFRVPHWLTFCYYYVTGGAFAICEKFNAMDDNKSVIDTSTRIEKVYSTAESYKPETHLRRAQQADEGDGKLVYWTWVLALATIALVVIAGGQLGMFFRQLRIMARGSTDTATVAVAAKTQADALVSSERARVFVEVFLSKALIATEGGQSMPFATVKFLNYSKTVAEITQIRAYCLVQTEIPNTLIDFPGSDLTLPPGLGIGSDGEFEVAVPSRLTNAEVANIRGWNTNMFCVGRMLYRDIFGHGWETGFCWRYVEHSGVTKFMMERNSALNKRT
jgi:hypothetical protein